MLTLILTLTGTIQQCDRGNQTCELSGITGESFDYIKCKYDSNLEGKILAAFLEEHQVTVSGTKNNVSSQLQLNSILKTKQLN